MEFSLTKGVAAGYGESHEAMSGYSGTPLGKKLGIKPGEVVWLREAPADFGALVSDVPMVAVSERPVGPVRLVVAFFVSAERLFAEIGELKQSIAVDGAIWICWPKRASKVPTDMTEQTIRDAALPIGLVDNKVCAVDATWSGLRLAIRRSLR